MAASNKKIPGLATTLEKCTDDISITVQFSGNRMYVINTNSKYTIRNLKECIAKEANISPRSINLVLAGQLLNDLALLQDYGLGAQTTLHAFCWSDDGLDCKDLPLRNLATSDRGAESVKDQPMAKYSRFFVFCKLCDCVRPAKLRLRCLECGSGAFLVTHGPSYWDDILSSTTIRGTCTTPGCTCKMPRFYLRCSENHEGEEEGTAVALKHIQANRKRVACIICQDIVSHILIFPCSPGHVICLDCFRQYGSTCLSERRFVEHPQHGYTLPCPAGCEDSHIEENHHFLLLGPEKYERYKNFGAEEYVLQNRGILCPAPGCGMGLIPEGTDRLVRCQECRFESCRECRRAYHVGACEEFLESLYLDPSDVTVSDERATRACWEKQTMSLIEETTKNCPGCQTKTERSGGCMHMICSRCGQEWCWVCVKPWNRDCQADHWFG